MVVKEKGKNGGRGKRNKYGAQSRMLGLREED